jgi:hypothetical protein
MDLNNNTGFTASQPCCCNHQGNPPAYESTSNPHSRGISSQNNANTELPPPYSTLDTESYVGEWTSNHTQGSWSRIVKRRGQIWYQYSFEKNDAIPWAGNGRTFFTCGMKPREGYNEEAIRRVCEGTVMDLKAHRGDCLDCAVQHIQTGGRSCLPSISGHQLRYSMARHDLTCSCKCFGLHSLPHPALSTPTTFGGTPQGTEASQPRSFEPAWKSEAQQGQFYWFRTIEKRGGFKLQCGINMNPGSRRSGEVPDLFFTCKMMPRAGYAQYDVTEICKYVALALKLHRTAKNEECSVCDFRHVQGKRIGCPASIFSTSRALFLHKMRRHDEACSCRCFHIDTFGTPVVDDTSGTPQPRRRTERQATHREPEIQRNTPDQAWEFAAGISSIDSYWTRMVKNGDDIWHQYGVSERQSDGRPDFFFTCKMKPRKRRNEQIIREVCMEITSVMRGHRSTNYHRCACNFQTWRKPGGPGGCRVSWYHLNKRITRNMIDFLMRSHDEVCSCGCFDIGSGEDADPSGQWLRD